VSNHVNIEVPDDEQYKRIKRVKNEHGLTWRGMLIHAADDLETPAGGNRWFASLSDAIHARPQNASRSGVRTRALLSLTP